MKFQNSTSLVITLLIVLVISGITIYFYNNALNELSAESCMHENGDCPHKKVVETQNMVILLLLFLNIVIVFGAIYLIFSKKEEALPLTERKIITNFDLEKIKDQNEKIVLGLVQNSDGSIFQSEIVKKTGFTKVKVSRILDRLEQRGLIERKRRGMTNLVVLK
ncbi:MAG: MarR family transcriptional regulator [Candidatus Micrarchaeota archaeon]|nr:MarR family transcriptional regulator [Candidatus Micrarchaeota archaeon]